MKNKKHVVIYHNNSQRVKTTPKDWARDNKNCFPNYGFTNNTNDIPITHEIVRYLIQECKFTSIVEGNFVITERK